jgi:nucleoid-associated protein YgaU
MIDAMTERSPAGADREAVCPFVAFDDDRDFRSTVPDHRHRCFAESPAASRALAHQAAYCLSSSFPGCPTFIDWARREAAPPVEQPIRTLRQAPTAPRQADRPAEQARRPVVPQGTPAPPPRLRRAEWTAPPPWAAEAGAAGAGASEAAVAPTGLPASDSDDRPAPDEVDASPGLGAWSGSALGALAAAGGPAAAGPAGAGQVRPFEPTADPDRESGFAPVEPAAPAFLAGRASRRPVGDGAAHQPADAGMSDDVPRAVPPRRAPVGYAPGDRGRTRVPRAGRDPDRVAGRGSDRVLDRGLDRDVADPAAPAWERPRRFEAYPSLKSGRGGLEALPRPVLYGLIVLVVGIVLFAAPFLYRGLTSGDGGAAASPTPVASASAGASAAPSITPVPSPSPTVYTVKAGDTLSRIAGKYGVTVDAIVKANPQIKDPNKLGLGDQLVIPPAEAPAITDSGTITSAPSPSAP